MKSPKNRLILEHLSFAQGLAYKFSYRFPAHFDKEELEAVAVAGLVEAAERYDNERPFKPFAAQRIRGAMLDSLRKNDILSRNERKAVKDLEKAKSKLRRSLNREPSIEELSSELDASPDHIRRAENSARARWASDKDHIGGLPSPHDLLQAKELKRIVAAAIGSLRPREKTVVNMYFLEGSSMREIAEVVQVSEGRISQILKKCLQRLVYRLAPLTDTPPKLGDANLRTLRGR